MNLVGLASLSVSTYSMLVDPSKQKHYTFRQVEDLRLLILSLQSFLFAFLEDKRNSTRNVITEVAPTIGENEHVPELKRRKE